VEAARRRQTTRFHDTSPDGNLSGIACNADMRPAEIRRFCGLGDTEQTLMRSAMAQMQLTARAHHRILKLARTIADLAASERIAAPHLAEALQYRPRLNAV
jgi:magnesium chelatase family protein